MQVTEKLGKKLIEATYLITENTKRYRPILRFFYEEVEKGRHFLYKEDVYEKLKDEMYFEEYSIEQCDSDLQALVAWGDLSIVQDTSKVNTLEEFKNKKFIYSITDTAIEIEKFTIMLENLHIDGGSLEPTLIERIKQEIMLTNTICDDTYIRVNGWWENLYADFKRLNENYQRYIKSFYNIKIEEVAQSDAFILMKNDLITYLREFIITLQTNSYEIEALFQNLSKDVEDKIMDKLYIAQSKVVRIDRLDVKISKEEIDTRNKEKWENLKTWFVGNSTRASEVANINDRTSNIIRKITKIANQIAETKGSVSSKKEDYRQLAYMFAKTDDIKEAHKLSSVVFGITNSRHIKGNFTKSTDDINTKISNQPQEIVSISPRTREFKERLAKVAIVDRSEEKQEEIKKYLESVKRINEMLNKYIKNNWLVISDIDGVVEKEVRKIVLSYISKASRTPNNETTTSDGRIVKLHLNKNLDKVKLVCEDGTLIMPAYELEFIQKN